MERARGEENNKLTPLALLSSVLGSQGYAAAGGSGLQLPLAAPPWAPPTATGGAQPLFPPAALLCPLHAQRAALLPLHSMHPHECNGPCALAAAALPLPAPQLPAPALASALGAGPVGLLRGLLLPPPPPPLPA